MIFEMSDFNVPPTRRQVRKEPLPSRPAAPRPLRRSLTRAYHSDIRDPIQSSSSGWPTSLGGGGSDDRGHDFERQSSTSPGPKDLGHPSAVLALRVNHFPADDCLRDLHLGEVLGRDGQRIIDKDDEVGEFARFQRAQARLLMDRLGW